MGRASRMNETLKTEQIRLKKVLEELHRQHEDNSQLMTNAGENMATLNREMWQEIGAVSIVNGIDQVAEFMSYMHQVKQSSRNLDFITQMDRKYKTMLASPYFGRIDFLEEKDTHKTPEAIYIGLGTLINEAHEFLIYDWRAPISSLFYDKEPGKVSYQSPDGAIHGELTLKRQYKIKDAQLQYVHDASVTLGDEVLMDILSQSTHTHMRHIVNSIQQEQNAIIRCDESKHLIVKGPAGSGKTSVALHRIAYLLYRHKDSLTANDLIIFSPNEVFGDYIADVLPQLGEAQIAQVTITQFMHRLIGNHIPLETYLEMMETLQSSKGLEKRRKAIAYKSSRTFTLDIEAYVDEISHRAPAFKDLIYKKKVIMDVKTQKDIYGSYESVTPLILRYEKVADRLLFLLKPSLYNQISEVFALDPMALYLERFSIGTSLEEGHKLSFEDQAGYLYFLAKLGGLRHTERMKHVVIDEAQDYTVVQMKLLLEVFKNAKFTLTGDPLQSINPSLGPENYHGIAGIFPEEQTLQLALQRTYRSTEEINGLARRIIGLGPDPHAVHRHGKTPEIHAFDTPRGTIEHLKKVLPYYQASTYKTVAVITRSIAETKAVYEALSETFSVCQITSDDDLYKQGLLVMPLFLAKGLEFDVVFVYDASEWHYPHSEGPWQLYTACTRALHELHLFHTGLLTPLLKKTLLTH